MDFHDITVLDISDKAIEKAQQRLGSKAMSVKWFVADIVDFQPTEKYDLWYDRVTFLYLTEEQEIDSYLYTADNG